MLYSSVTLSDAGRSPPWSSPFGEDTSESVTDATPTPDPKPLLSTTDLNETDASVNVNDNTSSAATIDDADKSDTVETGGPTDSIGLQANNVSSTNDIKERPDSTSQGEIPVSQVTMDLNPLVDRSTTLIK
jgi:hypothetical protein